MYIAEKDNEFYLNLQFRKADGENTEGLGYTDKDGNYIFELEASNENLDLQDQITLQSALVESKEFFLKNGVISNDHQHRQKDENGNVIVKNENVIGEPIAVRTEGKSTIVKGKLFGTSEKAKPFIDLLKANSTRVRGSVGGFKADIEKDSLTGIEKITHVHWNDLALTCSPVNDTVGYAVFAKSMNSDEFVRALQAGYGTDSATKTGGNVLIPENIGIETTDVTESKEKETLRALLAALQTGEINGERQAEIFLENNGFNSDESRAAVREIILQGGLAMKKSISDNLKEIMKSLSGKCDDDSEKDKKPKTGDGDDGKDGTIDLDGNGGADDDGGDDGDDDDDVVDGTELMKSLAAENEALHKSIGNLEKQMTEMGEGMVMLGEMVAAIGGQKMPPRSVINKSINGADDGGQGNGKMTKEDYSFAQKVLCDAVKNGELSIEKSTMWDSEIQKSMVMGTQISSECFSFIQNKWKNR